MAWVGKFEWGLLNAYAMRQRLGGGEFAILMSRHGHADDAPSIVGIGRHAPGLAAWSTHTAIVNAIQACQANYRNLIVFATYTPTEACLGAMKTHEMHSVSYVDLGGAPRFINMSASPNVTALVPAALPAVGAQNRVSVPAVLVPPAAVLANPAAGGGAGALAYLTQAAAAVPVPPRLAAWRVSWAPPGPVAGPRMMAALNQILQAGPAADQLYADTLFMLLVYTIAGGVAAPAHQGARIAGVLAAPTGEIYGWQVNQRRINPTYHAETNLVQGLGAAVPANATLYSTLEPCHQCAGLFVRAGGQRCVFGQNDPNMTGNTALQGMMSHRFNRTTFLLPGTSHMPGGGEFVAAGDRLDEIRNRASVSAQAAAAANFRQGGAAGGVRAAVAMANRQGIQRRVLDVLSAQPTLELFAQSKGMLARMIQVGRVLFAPGHPNRAVVENVDQVFQLFP